MLSRAIPALLVIAAACGGKYPAARSGGEARKKTLSVEQAALPYQILRGRGGAQVADAELLRELGEVQAICIGESHDNPHDHWAQLHLLDLVSRRNRDAGVTTGLGMEMFQRPFQGVLDDYAAGKIDDQALRARSDWANRWGFDFALYRPMIRMAVDRGGPVLALNLETELKKKISAAGKIEELPEAERARVPELVLDDAEHRAWFDRLMADMGAAHGHGGASSAHGEGKEPDPAEVKAKADKIYRGQVLWDETMADTAALWLKAGERRQLVILAGKGHCHDSAIVRRIMRRGVPRAVSIQPIIDDGEGNVAAALADPQNDYLFVMRPE